MSLDQIVLIDGWWGSGKSTLRGLLDGHSHAWVFPVQESFFGGLAADPYLKDWLEHRDVTGFRKNIYAFGDYARIEKEAREKRGLNLPSASQEVWNTFEFDFYKFDQRLVQRIDKLTKWTPDALGHVFYQTAIESMANKDVRTSQPRFAVTLENNRPKTPSFICKHANTVKYIWVDRDTEGILASYKARKAIPGLYETNRWNAFSLKTFVKNGDIDQINRARDRMHSLEQEHPEKIKVVRFENLVFQTASEMEKVRSFLDLPPEEILHRVTYSGSDFPGSSLYLGRINDDPETLFSDQERAFIRKQGQGGVSAYLRRVRRAIRHRWNLLLPSWRR